MLKNISLFSILLLLSGCDNLSPKKTFFWSDAESLIEEIEGENIRQHMRVLADDEMQGREAGTDNYDKAANYVIQKYEEYGLKPLSTNNNNYLQPIKFLESRLDLDSPNLSISNGRDTLDFVFKDEFIRSSGYGDNSEQVTASLVFVGYGINAPEYDHNDYSEIEVKDKILVVLSGAPPRFNTAQRAYYSSGRVKSELATELGALGIITIRTPVDQRRRAWERYLPGIGAPGMRWLNEDGTVYQGFVKLRGSALMSDTGAKKMFGFTDHDIDQIFTFHENGGIGSFDMGITATLSRESIKREVFSSNVIGYIEGSDNDLMHEYLVFSSHLDHLGIRGEKDGDNIYNGAYDNAAGIGSILEIAKVISSMSQKPKRSIIFAAVTAEEKGLQGSSYFVKNPLIPNENIIANINIDMPFLGFPVADLHAFGAEHSSLFDAVKTATDYLGIQFTPDPLPEEVRFVRSDQFSFVKEGIPAIGLRPGTISSDSSIDGAKELDNFLKNHYHQPSDDLNLPYSPKGAEGFVRTGLLLGLILADQDQKPSWNDGDFFGEKFGFK